MLVISLSHRDLFQDAAFEKLKCVKQLHVLETYSHELNQAVEEGNSLTLILRESCVATVAKDNHLARKEAHIMDLRQKLPVLKDKFDGLVHAR